MSLSLACAPLTRGKRRPYDSFRRSRTTTRWANVSRRRECIRFAMHLVLMRAADDENYADFLVSRETARKVCVDVKNVLFCFSELRDYRLPCFVSLFRVLFMQRDTEKSMKNGVYRFAFHFGWMLLEN